jgi:Uma2 family endonuclease
MATTTRLTYDDLESIPQEREGNRHELIDGEFVVTPAPVPAHQIISANIFRALDRLVQERGLGRVLYAPIDVRLTPDNVLMPDLIFIGHGRLHIIGPQAVDAAPDLVVEILSPGTRQRDLSTKRALYARFGVREYWIVDLETRNVTVLSLVSDQYVPIPLAKDVAIDSRVLPNLTLTLAAIFAEI